MQAGGYQNRALWSEEAWDWKAKESIGHPMFWRCEGNLWNYRTMFGEIRLPLEWPVYVSHAEATAYGKWLGRKLPTEAQFHRAAYGTKDGGRERSYPWGDEAPGPSKGNFDFKRGILCLWDHILLGQAHSACMILWGTGGVDADGVCSISRLSRPCPSIPATPQISLTASTM